MVDLGSLTPDGESSAYGINGGGDIVGYYTILGGANGAFFKPVDGAMVDLTSLVDNAHGRRVESAVAINDSGQILGCGNNHAYLLNPLAPAIPEINGQRSVGSILAMGSLVRLLRRRKTSSST